MDKNISTDISKDLSFKYSQKRLDHAKQSSTYVFKMASKTASQKRAEATGDLSGNKIANRITKVSKHCPKKNSETVTNENDKETSPEERQKIIDDLRLI